MGEMTTTLRSYLEANEHRGFSGSPHYYRDGDHLTFYASEDRCFAQRVNELLTVYVHHETGKLVGCKVKGITRVMENLQAMKVEVKDSEVQLGLIFISVAAITEEVESRQRVQDYGKELPAAMIPASELQLSTAA